MLYMQGARPMGVSFPGRWGALRFLLQLPVAGAVIRMLHKRARKGDRVVQILHRDPGRYASSKSGGSWGGGGGADIVVGRSMYETDSIPEHWRVPALCQVDELWEFNRRTFEQAGVPADRLRILHEPVDVSHFDPAARVSSRAPILPPCATSLPTRNPEPVIRE
ncbi:hypothetical protein T484DRAFT_1760301 [Baffinella frigidus]|nr:hypothetical protein T484DRAFT_1760301 [Cryptophyta sp. CCMP2293]